jgi:hypothetical protein
VSKPEPLGHPVQGIFLEHHEASIVLPTPTSSPNKMRPRNGFRTLRTVWIFLMPHWLKAGEMRGTKQFVGCPALPWLSRAGWALSDSRRREALLGLPCDQIAASVRLSAGRRQLRAFCSRGHLGRGANLSGNTRTFVDLTHAMMLCARNTGLAR